ncbi:MAG: bifunctional glutamate N-acetyltransferase/amino-acid acetyltransferase ArgJ [Calditrichaeota bacterium]|nr:bifunctional glutamate N-acetyltransferase/amino-acid acetyltransferase ArgJ [Calditrichota bacterium]
MINYKLGDGSATTPKGFRASGISCGIKENGKDLALIVSDISANVAAMYTTNTIPAAPVLISREKTKSGKAQALVINSGNANACTGEQGLGDAREMVSLVSKSAGIDEDDVLVASTGIIGRPMPMDKLRNGIPKAARALSAEGGVDAAEAIRTTDTRAKHFSIVFELDGKKCSIGAMAKGSGMINPQMATTINVLTTDVDISQNLLQQALLESVDISLNALTVDGSMSTNDCIFLFANGAADNEKITSDNESFQIFLDALKTICLLVAEELARDGEGATKLVLITVEGAKSKKEAQRAAKEIANAALVKTAIYGRDPNWGRVVAVIGGSGVKVDPAAFSIRFAGILVAENGCAADYDEAAMKEALDKEEISVQVSLGVGGYSAYVFTCDLTHEYVTINAEYTT